MSETSAYFLYLYSVEHKLMKIMWTNSMTWIIVFRCYEKYFLLNCKYCHNDCRGVEIRIKKIAFRTMTNKQQLLQITDRVHILRLSWNLFRTVLFLKYSALHYNASNKRQSLWAVTFFIISHYIHLSLLFSIDWQWPWLPLSVNRSNRFHLSR